MAGRRSAPTTVRQAIVLGISIFVIGVGVSQIMLSFMYLPSRPGDVSAYWDAAIRLRGGEPLYIRTNDPLAVEVYRYAPWFAWMWVPLTHLPRDLVETGWRAAMVLASVMALIPLMARRSIIHLAAAALIGAMTVQTALFGNVQPLLIAGLVWNVDRRGGPIWIAAAASLKFVPILYVVVYLGRREWGKAAMTLLLTMILVSPMLLHDLSGYTTTPGVTPSLFSLHPALWLVASACALTVAWLLARRGSPASWLVASAAVIVAYPQLHLSYLSHLLVGTRRPDESGG